MRGIWLAIPALTASLLAAELEIRVIYDNTSARQDLQEHWGFSALVSFRGRNVLFDSGTQPELFLENLGKLGIDPASIEHAVISHEHPDHRNGIYRLFPKNPSIQVHFLDSFVPEAFTQAEAIAMKPRRVTGPFEVAPGIYSTGTVEGSPPEQSLLIETSGGLVMLTGCSHPGVVKLVETALRQRKKDSIRLLLGGFHMFQSGADEIRPAIERLRKLHVERVMPAHCTGDLAKDMFRQAFGSRFDTAGAGKVIRLDLN